MAHDDVPRIIPARAGSTYDPQNGKIFTGDALEQFIKDTVQIVYLFRVDNVILDIDMAKELFKVVD